MKKKSSILLTMVTLMVMMFSICVLAEYGVNENYPYHVYCMQNAVVKTSNVISPMFTSNLRAGADIHMDCGTIRSKGTLMEYVQECDSTGNFTGTCVQITEVEVRGLSSYIDRHFYPVLEYKTPYKVVMGAQDGVDLTLVQVIINHH